MFSVPPKFAATLRLPHTPVCRVEAWLGSERIIDSVPILAGSRVDVDGSKGGSRRTLTLTTNADVGPLVTAEGTKLRAFRGLRYLDGTTALVPVGVFLIDTEAVGIGPDGNLKITAPDLWDEVVRARFPTPKVTNGRAVDEAERLILEPFAVKPPVVNTATSLLRTRWQVWDRERSDAALEILNEANAEAYFDGAGTLIIRNQPRITKAPVWSVDIGPRGVLIDADRETSRRRSYNAVVVTPAEVDGVKPFPPAVVDLDGRRWQDLTGLFGTWNGLLAANPTWDDVVAFSPNARPYFVTSPLARTYAQALAYGRSVLQRVTALTERLTLQSVVNPTLEPGDVITTVLPDLTERRHLIQSLTIPLDVETQQTIVTRTSRSDGTLDVTE